MLPNIAIAEVQSGKSSFAGGQSGQSKPTLETQGGGLDLTVQIRLRVNHVE